MNVFHKTVWISWNVMGFVKPKQISRANIRRLAGELFRGSVRHACTRASTRAGRVHRVSSFDFPFFLALHGRSLLVLAWAFLRRAVFLARANFKSLLATLVDMLRSCFDLLWRRNNSLGKRIILVHVLLRVAPKVIQPARLLLCL